MFIFNDGIAGYCFNLAEDTLLKRFMCSPSELITSFEVDTLEKYFNVLFNIYKNELELLSNARSVRPKDYIVLPLYNPRN